MIVLHRHQRNLECVLKFQIPKSYVRSSDPKSPLNLTIGILHKYPSDSNENQYLGIICLEAIKLGIYTVKMKWHDVQYFVRLSEHGFNTKMGKTGRQRKIEPFFFSRSPGAYHRVWGMMCTEYIFGKWMNEWRGINKNKFS